MLSRKPVLKKEASLQNIYNTNMRSTDMKMDTMPLKKRKFSHNIANIALVTNGNLNIIHTNEEEPNNTVTPNDIVIPPKSKDD